MTPGLIIYLFAAPALPPDALARREVPHDPIGRDAWRSIGAILMLMLPVSLFWGGCEQQGNTIALWASEYTDRHIGSFEIPVTWFQALNPFMIFAFTPFIAALWRRQGVREPSTVAKLAICCGLVALANLLMVAAAAYAGGERASWLWLFAYFVVLTIGELYLSPTSLSLVTKVAPLHLLSMMMDVWLSTSFIGGFLAGYLGTFWSSMTKPGFFLMLAMISALASIAIALLIRPLRSVLRD
jgi:proton-dependent oligopeptide transporter, POT family